MMKIYGKAFLNVLLAVIGAVFFITAVPKCLSFFMPFVIGYLMSLVAIWAVKILEKYLKIRKKAGSVCMILLVLILIFLLFYGTLLMLINQIKGILRTLPGMLLELQIFLQRMGEYWFVFLQKLPVEMQNYAMDLGYEVEDAISEFVHRAGNPSFHKIKYFAKSLPSAAISVVMSVLSAYFFTVDYMTMHNFLQDYMPKGIKRYWKMIKQSMKSAMCGYWKAQCKIEIIMFILLAIGFWILEISTPLLFAAIVALVDFLPLFGAGILLIPWAGILALDKQYSLAVGLLVVWIVTQIFRQVIQPKLVGDMVGLPPIPTLLLLYVGYKLGGFCGLIIVVPLGSILWDMYQAGVFDTLTNSIKIIIYGVNQIRRITAADMKSVYNNFIK